MKLCPKSPIRKISWKLITSVVAQENGDEKGDKYTDIPSIVDISSIFHSTLALTVPIHLPIGILLVVSFMPVGVGFFL